MWWSFRYHNIDKRDLTFVMWFIWFSVRAPHSDVSFMRPQHYLQLLFIDSWSDVADAHTHVPTMTTSFRPFHGLSAKGLDHDRRSTYAGSHTAISRRFAKSIRSDNIDFYFTHFLRVEHVLHHHFDTYIYIQCCVSFQSVECPFPQSFIVGRYQHTRAEQKARTSPVSVEPFLTPFRPVCFFISKFFSTWPVPMTSMRYAWNAVRWRSKSAIRYFWLKIPNKIE